MTPQDFRRTENLIPYTWAYLRTITQRCQCCGNFLQGTDPQFQLCNHCQWWASVALSILEREKRGGAA